MRDDGSLARGSARRQSAARGFQTAHWSRWRCSGCVVVTTGGLVRLTASGLGCPHWPTCEATSLVAVRVVHAVIEFTDR